MIVGRRLRFELELVKPPERGRRWVMPPEIKPGTVVPSWMGVGLGGGCEREKRESGWLVGDKGVGGRVLFLCSVYIWMGDVVGCLHAILWG